VSGFWFIPIVVGVVVIELAIRRYLRSVGVPKWTPDEAYVTRLRRWYQTRSR
jgi:hypothetical protein